MATATGTVTATGTATDRQPRNENGAFGPRFFWREQKSKRHRLGDEAHPLQSVQELLNDIRSLGDQALIDFQQSFAVGPRAAIVAKVQHAQLNIRQSRGFRQAFERQSAIHRAVAVGTQRRGRERLRGAIDEGEAPLERKRIPARILQQRAAQAHEGHELRARRRLRFQFTALLEPSKVAGYQRRFR